jgi:hypothetical protein
MGRPTRLDMEGGWETDKAVARKVKRVGKMLFVDSGEKPFLNSVISWTVPPGLIKLIKKDESAEIRYAGIII